MAPAAGGESQGTLLDQLHAALCQLYCGYLDQAVRELQPDGFFTSDDLGHQTQSMLSPQLFEAFIKPYSCNSTSYCSGMGCIGGCIAVAIILCFCPH